MACYGNERKAQRPLCRALSLRRRKVICHVSHPDQVITMGCSTKTVPVHKIDVCCCLEAALTTLLDILFVFNAVPVSFLKHPVFNHLR